MSTKALTVISQLLNQNRNQIQLALPSHLKLDRLIRIAVTEVRKNPDLLKCDPLSVCGAVVQAAQLGLEPGGALGHCYLVPFKGKAQLMLGYRGMIDLSRRSNAIKSISARVVFEADNFEYEYGIDERLVHKPKADGRGDPIFFYAVAHFKDGGHQFEVMSVADVEKVRRKSAFPNSGPWKEHFEEMGKKTVIRRLFKYLPVSIEMQQAVGMDEMADAGIDQDNGTILEHSEFTSTESDGADPIKDINSQVASTAKQDAVKTPVNEQNVV